MLNKKLIIKDGLAYEEDSDLPFTSSFKEFHANGALKKVSNYVDGKLHGLVQTYDRDGVPWQQQHWRKGELDIDREDISQETYDIDSLKILFSSSIRKQLSTCYISSGNTHSAISPTLHGFLEYSVLSSQYNGFLLQSSLEPW